MIRKKSCGGRQKARHYIANPTYVCHTFEKFEIREGIDEELRQI
jgi:hypothetical protein